ncbi:MAG: cytidine deaminase family protein, partial [Legionella sp.]
CIKDIVILAGTNLFCPPCGACRQRIHEFSTPETSIHLCDKQAILSSVTMNELLPLAFNFKP